jgi:hypothetical protein
MPNWCVCDQVVLILESVHSAHADHYPVFYREVRSEIALGYNI